MKALPNNAPTNVAALDPRDPEAGGASHVYGVQYGGPKDVLRVQFQHGPRGVASSTSGVFDDDLLAIVQDRIEGFQAGPFACVENQAALDAVQAAREALGSRVARRISQGVLGANEVHAEADKSKRAAPSVGRIVHVNIGTDTDPQWRAAVVTAAFGGDLCNVSILLDGSNDQSAYRALPPGLDRADELHARGYSRPEGDGPGCWRWPPRE